MASTEEIRAGLADLIAEVVGCPAAEVQPEKTLVDDLEVDSLSMVEVIVAAEQKFGVVIADEQVKHLRTVQDVVDYIERAQG